VLPYRQRDYRDLPVPHPLGELEAAHGELLSLPMGPHLSDAQADHVIDAVLRFGGTLRAFPSRSWATGTSAP
jgi:dTDP-4-amino-4,6-dideoxygalactose transaminase